MTIYRARVLDTPDDPFTGGTLRAGDDVALRVAAGTISERGQPADLIAKHPDEDVVDLRDGLLLPGLVDTHVHYPQVHVIGGLGLPLLDWLEQQALPEEARLADIGYATAVAQEFVSGLVAAGTTTALVFGAHFASAVDAMFTEAARVGIRVTGGLVVSDRILRADLLTTPELAYEQACALAARWHGTGRARYAVTPRFSLSTTSEMLESCAAVLKQVPGAWFTSHINENLSEMAQVATLFPESRDYLDTYDRFQLLGRSSVLAHNVHPTDRELAVLADQGVVISHCPTSNSALGSGLFPLRRHLDRGVRVALGSDVGGGTGFCLFKEGLQAYFIQQVQGPDGVPLSPAHLLHLVTNAGASALGLADQIGDLSPGKAFDAILVRPAVGSTLDTCLKHAADGSDALAKIFAMASPADVTRVWVGGDELTGG